jgi:toxin ParE1/3/4
VIYRLSVPAEADLAEIWVYSAEQWNLDQADRYIDALLSRLDWLCENPQLWKPRSDITKVISQSKYTYICDTSSHT